MVRDLGLEFAPDLLRDLVYVVPYAVCGFRYAYTRVKMHPICAREYV